MGGCSSKPLTNEHDHKEPPPISKPEEEEEEEEEEEGGGDDDDGEEEKRVKGKAEVAFSDKNKMKENRSRSLKSLFVQHAREERDIIGNVGTLQQLMQHPLDWKDVQEFNHLGTEGLKSLKEIKKEKPEKFLNNKTVMEEAYDNPEKLRTLQGIIYESEKEKIQHVSMIKTQMENPEKVETVNPKREQLEDVQSENTDMAEASDDQKNLKTLPHTISEPKKDTPDQFISIKNVPSITIDSGNIFHNPEKDIIVQGVTSEQLPKPRKVSETIVSSFGRPSEPNGSDPKFIEESSEFHFDVKQENVKDVSPLVEDHPESYANDISAIPVGMKHMFTEASIQLSNVENGNVKGVSPPVKDHMKEYAEDIAAIDVMKHIQHAEYVSPTLVEDHPEAYANDISAIHVGMKHMFTEASIQLSDVENGNVKGVSPSVKDHMKEYAEDIAAIDVMKHIQHAEYVNTTYFPETEQSVTLSGSDRLSMLGAYKKTSGDKPIYDGSDKSIDDSGIIAPGQAISHALNTNEHGSEPLISDGLESQKIVNLVQCQKIENEIESPKLSQESRRNLVQIDNDLESDIKLTEPQITEEKAMTSETQNHERIVSENALNFRHSELILNEGNVTKDIEFAKSIDEIKSVKIDYIKTLGKKEGCHYINVSGRLDTDQCFSLQNEKLENFGGAKSQIEIESDQKADGQVAEQHDDLFLSVSSTELDVIRLITSHGTEHAEAEMKISVDESSIQPAFAATQVNPGIAKQYESRSRKDDSQFLIEEIITNEENADKGWDRR